MKPFFRAFVIVLLVGIVVVFFISKECRVGLPSPSGELEVSFITPFLQTQQTSKNKINVVKVVPDSLHGDESDRIADACSSADTVILEGVYNVNKAIYITTPTVIIGGGILIFDSIIDAGVIINSSDVCIDGIEFRTDTGNSDMIQDMIQVLGDNKRPCLSIRIVNCSIEGGYHGIRLDFCKKSLVMSNTIRKVENTGIGLYSCQDIRLEYNTIIDVNTEHKWQTSYGISATYHYGDPKSRNILIANNTVINNPFWEALDTHGGEHICFINNKIKNCWRGIAAVGDDHSIHQVCDDIKIINNTIDCSSVSLSNGIVFTGIGDDELSESFTIKDNIIHSAVIGLYSNYTRGVILENNKVTAKDEGWRDKGSYDIVFKKNIIELGKEEPTYYEKCGVYLSLSKCSSHNIIGSFKDNTLRTNYAPGFVAPQNFAKVDAKMAFQNNYIETLTTKYKGGAVSDNSINMHYFNAIFE